MLALLTLLLLVLPIVVLLRAAKRYATWKQWDEEQGWVEPTRKERAWPTVSLKAMKQLLLICAVMMLLGCGKKVPEQQANMPDANPPAQPPVKELKKAPAKPKVEPA